MQPRYALGEDLRHVAERPVGDPHGKSDVGTDGSHDIRSKRDDEGDDLLVVRGGVIPTQGVEFVRVIEAGVDARLVLVGILPRERSRGHRRQPVDHPAELVVEVAVDFAEIHIVGVDDGGKSAEHVENHHDGPEAGCGALCELGHLGFRREPFEILHQLVKLGEDFVFVDGARVKRFQFFAEFVQFFHHAVEEIARLFQRRGVRFGILTDKTGIGLGRESGGVFVLLRQDVEAILEILEVCFVELGLERRDGFLREVDEHLDRGDRLVDLVHVVVQRSDRDAELFVVIRLLLFEHHIQPGSRAAVADQILVEDVHGRSGAEFLQHLFRADAGKRERQGIVLVVGIHRQHLRYGIVERRSLFALQHVVDGAVYAGICRKAALKQQILLERQILINRDRAF